MDANGNLTVVGSTNATNFPITSGVYQTGGGAFITRISSDGSQLIWSTEIGGAVSLPGLQRSFSAAQSVAIDSSDNVYVAGSAPSAIATTPGALQSSVPGSGSAAIGFAAELSSDATQLLFATNLGGTDGATLTGLALDPGGNVWISGNTRSPDFPGLNNPSSAGLNFALELNANASALQQIVGLVPGTVTQPPAFDSSGDLLLLGSGGNLLRLSPTSALAVPAVFAITDSAATQATAGIAVGELATLYGTGLGPSQGIVGGPDANGVYPTQLGGVRVEFNGAAAPLLYVGSDQINFQAPFNLTYPATMTVITPTATLAPMQLPLIGSIGVFGVLNQDGSLNSAANPAQSGSIVSLYATGLGAPSPTAQDGAISQSAVSAFQDTVEVTFLGSLYPLPLWYAGTAPGLINGLDQLNVQLPAAVQNPTLAISRLAPVNGSAAATSNLVLVYAQ